MPQFLIDWNDWWMAFWAAHPWLFWVAASACGGLELVRRRMR